MNPLPINLFAELLGWIALAILGGWLAYRETPTLIDGKKKLPTDLDV